MVTHIKAVLWVHRGDYYNCYAFSHAFLTCHRLTKEVLVREARLHPSFVSLPRTLACLSTHTDTRHAHKHKSSSTQTQQLKSNEANNEFPQCIAARLPCFKWERCHQHLNAWLMAQKCGWLWDMPAPNDKQLLILCNENLNTNHWSCTVLTLYVVLYVPFIPSHPPTITTIPTLPAIPRVSRQTFTK